MSGNKYLYLTVLSLNLVCCVCYVNYELFHGFDPPTTHKSRPNTTHAPANVHTRKVHVHVYGLTTVEPEIDYTSVDNKLKPIVPTTVTTSTLTSGGKTFDFTNGNNDFQTTPQKGIGQRKPKIKVKQFKRKCPENERPLSIGTYEIPTQRDLVLFTQRTLLKMFNSYHQKTLYLLKDIKEATRATVEVEKKCHGKGKTLYKKCVKQVSRKCVTITKELVQSLEHQEAEVIALTEDKICNLTSMRTDPIKLIKILAMDEASLDFALPAFLRLLGGCTTYCHKPAPPDHRPRLRQLTDQDLVVRHFLTSKNYVQLIKDTHKYG